MPSTTLRLLLRQACSWSYPCLDTDSSWRTGLSWVIFSTVPSVNWELQYLVQQRRDKPVIVYQLWTLGSAQHLPADFTGAQAGVFVFSF